MTGKFSTPVNDPIATRRRQLIQKIQEDSALPALGSSVSQVVQIATSSHEAVQSLAHFILSDMALTQKILSVANTVAYRTASGTPVTTISKAIFLLGFDAVKTIALTMLLVEGLTGKSALLVRQELVQAVGASLVGRELARSSAFKDAEEAAVVGLFKNLGRLLVLMHDETSYDEIIALSATGACTPAQAAMQILGCGFDSLADSVLRQWQIPLTIIKALSPLPAGSVRIATNRQDWLQQVASFSSEVAVLLSHSAPAGISMMTRNLLARYGTALDLDPNSLRELMIRVAEETRILTNTLYPETIASNGKDSFLSDDEAIAEDVLDDFLLVTDEPGVKSEDQRYPSGKPMNARNLLLAGVQDVSEMVASGRCKANDLMMLVLETIYHGMGFRFATACIKDAKSQHFRARISLGKDSERLQSGFAFPLAGEHDLFHLAIKNDVDILISDAGERKVQALIPHWHRKLLADAASFIILPIVVKKQVFGLIYADRLCIADEGISPEEASLIKTLKAQIMASLSGY